MIRNRWLLIVAIAAALVGMHHLVAEHRGHAGPFAHAPLTLAAGVGSLLMSPTPAERPPAVASDQGGPGHLRAGVGAGAARAQPTGSVRCTQLYVLRR
jgi:hypothetical protein